jgi:hypothetical protein
MHAWSSSSYLRAAGCLTLKIAAEVKGGVCAECSGGFGSRNASFLGLHLENLITSGIGALCLRLWPRFIRISRAGPKIDALRPRVLAAYRGQLRNSKHNRAVQAGARFSEREAGVGRLDSSRRRFGAS